MVDHYPGADPGESGQDVYYASWNQADLPNGTVNLPPIHELHSTAHADTNFNLPPFVQRDARGLANPPMNASRPTISIPRRAASRDFDVPDNDSSDDGAADLIPPSHLGYSSARKVKGFCHSNAKGKGKAVDKGKGKAPAKRTADDDAPNPKRRKTAKGRVPGSENFSEADLGYFLGDVKDNLPIGQKGWGDTTDRYNGYAQENGRMIRGSWCTQEEVQGGTLTRKPTGDANIPWYVKLAKEIDHDINSKIAARSIDDKGNKKSSSDEETSSDDDSDDNGSDYTPRNCPTRPLPKRAARSIPVARRAPSDRFSSRATNATARPGLLSRLSDAFDPDLQRQRSEGRALQTMQANQLISLQSQLQEIQHINETLRTRISDLERERTDLQRRIDRTKLLSLLRSQSPSRTGMTPTLPRSPLDRYRMGHTPRSYNRHSVTPRASRHASCSTRTPPPRRPWYRQDIYYSNGGQHTRFINGDESDNGMPEEFSPGTRIVTRPSPSSPSPVHSPKAPEEDVDMEDN
ncbi:hypothetical protein BDN72DRAFT_905684 [Pluteus cervinus]|uniref:Uncharacterized protein n=1 Tax=Pluteus cervinus TaxID=181527 RepID=A0ACD3A225_9AGAR|nr:hypothetical protein BDN72DRAFT_905684 [Pluteus cervinus]